MLHAPPFWFGLCPVASCRLSGRLRGVRENLIALPQGAPGAHLNLGLGLLASWPPPLLRLHLSRLETTSRERIGPNLVGGASFELGHLELHELPPTLAEPNLSSQVSW